MPFGHRLGLNICYTLASNKVQVVEERDCFKGISDADFDCYFNFIKLQNILSNPLSLFQTDNSSLVDFRISNSTEASAVRKV